MFREQAEMSRAVDTQREATGYERPRSVEEALRALAGGAYKVLAGGTDHFAAPVEGVSNLPILDITAIDELRGIEAGKEAWRIGALTTWSEIAGAGLPPAFDGLRLAAREVGSIQIQNRATIAGNLCNASPAADGVPPLLCLDAMIELRSLNSIRCLPLADFLTGYRTTALRPDELMTAILVPREAEAGRSGFLKLGARKFLVISIAMVAARLVLDRAGRIESARVAVGACSPVACRLAGLESKLVGADPRSDLARLVADADLAPLSPIDDVRASAEYRKAAVRELVLRALQQVTA